MCHVFVQTGKLVSYLTTKHLYEVVFRAKEQHLFLSRRTEAAFSNRAENDEEPKFITLVHPKTGMSCNKIDFAHLAFALLKKVKKQRTLNNVQQTRHDGSISAKGLSTLALGGRGKGCYNATDIK